ncbi:MAG: hypothetical protein COS26_00480 [Candidatus Nealsonbacteria bacterium CG02_land_8_20_14_3_00_40_11]|uniref:Uncharacterized protein n=1 Tax=Candidatus Nealsonbacteria bacterium CG02_land_8_20_14_3_00_40_11 TaxID=1974700 RepID=A0A2M7D8L4_9BACT|nr:MAG: hypothetical protein COS26_00480 [Candidatus Nealsonbacteria bacterium CG02_land_8_20_14_3_00_40_11]
MIRGITDTTFGGRMAKRISVFDFDSMRIEIITINKGNVYNLSFNDAPEGNDPDNARHQQIYSQMLSIFRFME